MLDLLDYRNAVVAIRAHLAALFVIFARINPPAMTKRPQDYWTGQTVGQAAWDELLKRSRDNNYEAHIHKVIDLDHTWQRTVHCGQLRNSHRSFTYIANVYHP